jgi:hypothetical protein
MLLLVVVGGNSIRHEILPVTAERAKLKLFPARQERQADRIRAGNETDNITDS